MIKWAKKLFPYCRSLTGEGTQRTLRFFKNLNKEFKIIKYKSEAKYLIGKSLEWNIKEAYIEHSSKKNLLNLKKITYILLDIQDR